MQKFRKFITISKIDEEEKMVYGWASTEDVDSDGEIIKASALEKALPEYLKFPTLREMHQPIAVGKTTTADVKKEGKTKGLYIGAKVVAADAWEKVKEGIYPAFSIGGNILKKVGNVIHELDLIEISLVDVPANKAAVVELWKKDKLSKNAKTAYAMSNLMIQVRDMISYYEYLGKDTKKLKKCLEIIKQVLSTEASEEENYDSKDGDMFSAANPTDLKKKISILEAMDFSKDPFADLIRKGVIMSMKKKVVEKREDLEEKDIEETQDPEEKEEKEEKDPEDKEEEKAAGEMDATLQKLKETNDKIEKLAPTLEDKKQSEDLVKAVSVMAGSLAKFADALTSIDGRLAKLEKTPAAPKSKSPAVVLKGQDKENLDDTPATGRLAEIKKRLAELNKIFDNIGAHAFAKQGLSREAMALQIEKEKLESKTQA